MAVNRLAHQSYAEFSNELIVIIIELTEFTIIK